MTPLYYVRLKYEEALTRLEYLFKEDIRLTLIARIPDDPEAELVLTKDDLEEVQAMVERSKKREEYIP